MSAVRFSLLSRWIWILASFASGRPGTCRDPFPLLGGHMTTSFSHIGFEDFFSRAIPQVNGDRVHLSSQSLPGCTLPSRYFDSSLLAPFNERRRFTPEPPAPPLDTNTPLYLPRRSSYFPPISLSLTRMKLSQLTNSPRVSPKYTFFEYYFPRPQPPQNFYPSEGSFIFPSTPLTHLCVRLVVPLVPLN